MDVLILHWFDFFFSFFSFPSSNAVLCLLHPVMVGQSAFLCLLRCPGEVSEVAAELPVALGDTYRPVSERLERLLRGLELSRLP